MSEILLIGDPIAHSRSPVMQNAALAALGSSARYLAVQTPLAELAARIASLRAPERLGANVTLPHKEAVLPLLDKLEPEAAQIGAVNTIYKGADGALIGANTDAPGLLADLRAAQADPAGQRTLVLGASGAARAAAFALLWGGAREVVIANRSRARAEALVDHLRDQAGGQGPRVSWCELGAVGEQAPFDLIINATAIGWHGDESPLEAVPIRPGGLAYDMVYRQTRLLMLAIAAGGRSRDGLGMLVYQGGLALERWIGQPAPFELMFRALGRRA